MDLNLYYRVNHEIAKKNILEYIRRSCECNVSEDDCENRPKWRRRVKKT